MITTLLYSLTGLMLFAMGLFTLIVHSHPLRKILAVNVMATGVFLILVATAYIPLGQGEIDPVPHAMVLTGIVVSVSVTALALILACRVQETSNLDLLARRKQPEKTTKESGA
jgi:multicomponent Na+:H+ antiporter subunit C